MPIRTNIVFPLILLLAQSAFSEEPHFTAEELHRFDAPEAHQGVAVDGEYFYAIGNRVLGKYRKADGQRVARWEGDPEGPVQHLNSCTVVGRELHCAHSNYPGVPMHSSLEVFSTDTLQPLRSWSFGIRHGSLTWAEFHQGHWWLTFAHYENRAQQLDQDSGWTQLVQFSAEQFQRRQGWVFPSPIVARFRPMSSSGGAWNADGYLYVTGHDHRELYLMRLPAMGSTLEYLATVAIPTGGQAIDFDPDNPRHLYSIDRDKKQVVVSRIPTVEP